MSLGRFRLTFYGHDVTHLLGPRVARRLFRRKWRRGQKRNRRQRCEGKARHVLVSAIRAGHHAPPDALTLWETP